MYTEDIMTRQVLYAHSSSLIGGGNKVLLTLFDQLDRSRVDPISMLPDSGPMQEALGQHNVEHFIATPSSPSDTRLRSALKASRMYWQCRQRGIDTIHANDPYTYRLLSVVAKYTKAARVCHVHHPGQNSESLAWSFRIPPDLVITPSQFVKQQVVNGIDLPNTRVEAVWNPIDIDWFSPAPNVVELRTRLNMAPAGKHVCILGALAPHKGHLTFLKMAERVLKSHPDCQFHIVGSAKTGCEEHAVRVREFAHDRLPKSSVRFWGFVDDQTARDVLRASDLFVLPSREEGFGLVLAEAQACEVPVLTSRISPLEEVVDDGHTGYLIDPDDVAEFSERASCLLGDSTATRYMGVAGREWVVSRFSAQVYAEKIQDLYETLASKRTSVGSMNRNPVEVA